jgi:ankyrin repeat protein
MADIFKHADSWGYWTENGSGAGGLRAALAAHPKDCDTFRDAEGATALMVAAAKGHTAKVKLLLGAGADASIKDKMGRTALWYASEGTSNTDTVAALMEHGGAKLAKVRSCEGCSLVEPRCRAALVSSVWGHRPCDAGQGQGWRVAHHARARPRAEEDRGADEGRGVVGATRLPRDPTDARAPTVKGAATCRAKKTATTTDVTAALSACPRTNKVH